METSFDIRGFQLVALGQVTIKVSHAPLDKLAGWISGCAMPGSPKLESRICKSSCVQGHDEKISKNARHAMKWRKVPKVHQCFVDFVLLDKFLNSLMKPGGHMSTWAETALGPVQYHCIDAKCVNFLQVCIWSMLKPGNKGTYEQLHLQTPSIFLPLPSKFRPLMMP